jgi:hypothetical protein
LNSTEERTEPYVEAKREKEKVEIAADGETKKVYFDDMPDRAVTIGAHLTPEDENELVQFLNKNKDIFACLAKDLQGVDRDIIGHTLETNERILPKKKKLRKMSKEKVKAVEAEFHRLQDVKVIREVLYPLWMANTLPVKKKNGKWRMCVVTEPPKVIMYYRLSLSTWPLSNNKELLCRFCRLKLDKSLTIGSRYALSPHEGGTRVHHYIT